MTSPRGLLALAAGKSARIGLQALGRGGTALPGVIALAIAPRLSGELAARLAHGVACVTGTNGKTTTARMLAAMAREAGWSPVHNRAGANLDRGIAAALLADARVSGEPRGDLGVFEVDEASVPRVVAAVAPRVLVVTNLFRDQMDRYHELDALVRRLAEAVERLPPSTTLVLNADDPLVVRVAERHHGTVVFFGIDDPDVGGGEVQAISDATRCPRCGAPLRYRRVILAHEGDWACSACDFARPRRDVAAVRVRRSGGGLDLTLAGGEVLTVPIPGAYNAHNALAAVAAARALGLPAEAQERALASFRPAFGRQESIAVDGKRVRLLLVKNPAGFDAAAGALVDGRQPAPMLLALSDRDADGRDVSWIWDADFERVLPVIASATVTGLRARDLALRLKYAGLPRERTRVVESWPEALDAALAATAPGAELVLLATYTAMLALRAELARRGHAAAFWDD